MNFQSSLKFMATLWPRISVLLTLSCLISHLAATSHTLHHTWHLTHHLAHHIMNHLEWAISGRGVSWRTLLLELWLGLKLNVGLLILSLPLLLLLWVCLIREHTIILCALLLWHLVLIRILIEWVHNDMKWKVDISYGFHMIT